MACIRKVHSMVVDSRRNVSLQRPQPSATFATNRQPREGDTNQSIVGMDSESVSLSQRLCWRWIRPIYPYHATRKISCPPKFYQIGTDPAVKASRRTFEVDIFNISDIVPFEDWLCLKWVLQRIRLPNFLDFRSDAAGQSKRCEQAEALHHCRALKRQYPEEEVALGWPSC